ncbi:MAG: type II secretion system protein [Psychrilyobacter sp.]|uniref:type II secretion system protein n=1 Tax=Psychrilyobacter sp. TaxID=2586924 RepID=UPI003C77DBAD
MKKKLKNGFTMIEVLIVITIIGVLSVVVTSKLLKEMRKATVAKVQHNLGVIRSRLSLDEILLEGFPNLYGEINTDLLKAYSIDPTPPFSDREGKNHEATLKVVYSRSDDGGWLYNRDLGEIYANLPDGAYTKDEEYEIWGGETPAISKITYNGEKNLRYGKLQFKNEDGYWEDMVDGEVYSSDTEIQYVPSEGNILGDANQINIGTATGVEAKLDDWGIVDGNKAIKILDDGTTITTSVLNGNLKEFNGDGTQGNGIGSDKLSSGLNLNNTLKVDVNGADVNGADVNKVIFTLDGLGSWFDENSSNATKINITAYDENDEEISTQGGYRKSGLFSDTYSFEITEPVAYFVLGSEAGNEGSLGNGTYVVQNVSLIKSVQESVNLTIKNPDGTTKEISKDILLDNTNSSDSISINEKSQENN